MVFGGIQKNSMIDFPGKLACVLFASGCNFDCPYCHNPQLVQGCKDRCGELSQDEVDQFLDRRKHFLDGVVISGGEPTLQADLVSICRKIKAMGYPVKLDTNGSRPRVIRELLDEGLLDYIAMDIKTDPERYASLIKKYENAGAILESIEIIMGAGIDYEFRTTCVKPLIDADVIARIVRVIKGAERYALQQFEAHTVLHPELFQGSYTGYACEDLAYFKTIAEPWVQTCLVR